MQFGLNGCRLEAEFFCRMRNECPCRADTEGFAGSWDDERHQIWLLRPIRRRGNDCRCFLDLIDPAEVLLNLLQLEPLPADLNLRVLPTYETQ